MKATIIGIGDEVLYGDVLNSNASFLAKELTALGIDVVEHLVVSDNEEMMITAYKEAINLSDLIITTGGLGPTQDDMTKDVFAKILDCPLERNEEIVKILEEHFSRSQFKLTENNYSQAYIPKGAKVIKNEIGTAPGVLLEKDNKILIMFPGPPREMKPMYKNQIEKYLMKKIQKFFAVKNYMTVGIGESPLEDELRKVLPEKDDISVNTYFNDCGVRMRAVAIAHNEKEAEEKLIEVDKIIKEHFSQYIYSEKEEMLNQTLVNALICNDISFSVAESCTGGKLSSLITAVPGSSAVFMGGAITYSNEAKMKLLGVKEETLEKFGAVSEECAKEMAEGCAKLFNTDVAVSVTGIAGPTGQTEEKPLGLVYMGIYNKGKVEAYKYNFSGNREKVQRRSAYYALELVRKNVL